MESSGHLFISCDAVLEVAWEEREQDLLGEVTAFVEGEWGLDGHCCVAIAEVYSSRVETCEVVFKSECSLSFANEKARDTRLNAKC